MTRPSLLFLCHITPYPPDGGAEIRSYHLLRLLAEDFDVRAMCLGSPGEPGPAIAARARQLALATGSEVFAYSRPAATLGATARAHLASVVSRRVYTTHTARSDELERGIQVALRDGQFQVVHVDSLDLSAYLPLLPLSKVVCGHHNVESELLKRRGDAHPSRLVRRYVHHQARLTAAEERRWCPQVALNITVSENDREALLRIAPGSRAAVVPNGVDTRRITPGEGPSNGIVFVGGVRWFPNRDALAYFATDVLPIVRDAVDVKVTWVGHTDSAARRIAERAGIHMTGFVADVVPHLQTAACFVAPLRVGGGTRLKILDAWSAGLPVVSTSIGCEGLAAVDETNILIRDDPKSFADAIVGVLRDRQLQHRLGGAARRTVEQVYSWDVIRKEMLPLYDAISGIPAR